MLINFVMLHTCTLKLKSHIFHTKTPFYGQYFALIIVAIFSKQCKFKVNTVVNTGNCLN